MVTIIRYKKDYSHQRYPNARHYKRDLNAKNDNNSIFMQYRAQELKEAKDKFYHNKGKERI